MISAKFFDQMIKASFLHRCCFMTPFSSTKRLSKRDSLAHNNPSLSMQWKPIQMPARQRPIKLLVVRNYLLPERPKLYKDIHTFLSYSGKYPSTLTTKQLMYKVKNMNEEELTKYRKMMKYQNQMLQYEQKQYDRIFGKALIKLPFYYHMLLAQSQLPSGQHIQNMQGTERQQGEVRQQQNVNDEDNNIEQQLVSVLNFKEIQKYLSKTLTPHQMFMKLYTIHPYLKYKTYLKYIQIHNQFAQKQKNSNNSFLKFTFRIPILYFRHPYELYLIDQCEKLQRKLTQQQFYMKMEDIRDFDYKLQSLGKILKEKYQGKAQKLLMEYETQIQIIMLNTKLSKTTIHKLIENQFNLENQKMIQRMIVK